MTKMMMMLTYPMTIQIDPMDDLVLGGVDDVGSHALLMRGREGGVTAAVLLLLHQPPLILFKLKLCKILK